MTSRRSASAAIAKAIRPLRLTEQGSIAIPVMVDGEPIAALAVRFALTAVSFEDARRRLLPALQEIAHRPCKRLRANAARRYPLASGTHRGPNRVRRSAGR